MFSLSSEVSSLYISGEVLLDVGFNLFDYGVWQISSDTRSAKSVQEKILLPLLRFIPQLVSQLSSAWKSRLLKVLIISLRFFFDLKDLLPYCDKYIYFLHFDFTLYTLLPWRHVRISHMLVLNYCLWLQAFTKAFMECNPQSSLKLACIPIIEQMICPVSVDLSSDCSGSFLFFFHFFIKWHTVLIKKFLSHVWTIIFIQINRQKPWFI